VISAAENSNKFKKPGFEKKNQLWTNAHLGLTVHATSFA
jgi:hypothetical protein